MKYTFQWILVVVCLLIVGNTQAMADEKKDVKVFIPLTTGDVIDGGEARNGEILPFTVYYQGGTFYISTSAEFSSIDVSVVNETTNQTWDATTDISDGMGEISISDGGVGSYTIEIVTEYGECFTGNFRL